MRKPAIEKLLERAKLVRVARLWSAAAVLLVAAGMGAQSPGASAALVAQRALSAHGARWASGDIRDWIAEGKVTLFSVDGPRASFDMTLLRRGSLQVQRIIKQSPGDLKQGSDGTRSWESIAGFHAPQAHGRTLHFIESQTVRSPQRLLNYQAEGLILRDVRLDGDAQVIDAEDREGRRTAYHVNRQTSTIDKVEFAAAEAKDPFSGRRVPVIETFVFSDYRNVQGARTAFKVERFSDGVKIEEMQLTAVRYNEGLEARDFRR